MCEVGHYVQFVGVFQTKYWPIFTRLLFFNYKIIMMREICIRVDIDSFALPCMEKNSSLCWLDRIISEGFNEFLFIKALKLFQLYFIFTLISLKNNQYAVLR